MVALQKGKEKGHFAHGFVMQTSSVTLTLLFRKSVNSHTLGIKTERQGATYGGTGECGLAVLNFMYDDFTEPRTELSSCIPLTLAKITAFNTVEGLLRKTSGFLHHRL